MQEFPLEVYEIKSYHAVGCWVTLHAEHAIKALIGSIALISAVTQFQTIGHWIRDDEGLSDTLDDLNLAPMACFSARMLSQQRFEDRRLEPPAE
ncbi:hypothetical protein CH63R_06905 [Colletotrichum higginsianum IMI 349063]|uniref:Uncharacterized protein n=1 Tax=Colletotrichum higginsianum (strain IMI 349063) TaxID=759273 RepID=A0A1B7YGL0_COLHI|nr:hypothetical protein CH63R_06905 [Colletotrichum higginsianum IMI 349063]OBR11213.1 hypothetical protein CH63R_06905 [Colletotrichum higginsianum IMI 349063]